MTEAEWLSCSDPEPMLKVLQDQMSERKPRLFACACCRRVKYLLSDERSQQAIEVAERHADGITGDEELALTSAQAHQVFLSIPWDRNGMAGAIKLAASVVWGVTAQATEESIFDDDPLPGFVRNTILQTSDATDNPEVERSEQAHFLRDIFGNPFRPITLDPSWLTFTVVSLAKQMYESRDFSAMPILADALQDAGCDNTAILDHCCGSGPHVRGCWVVDKLLSKE